MIRDTLTTFATAVASGQVGTRQFGDVVDTKALGPTTNVGTNLGGQRDLGAGQNVRVIATVDTSYTGSATLVSFAVVTSDNANLTTPTTLATFAPATVTEMIAGAIIGNAVLPSEGSAYKRYIGVTETVVGSVTTGKASIGLALDDFTKPTKAYAQGDVAF